MKVETKDMTLPEALAKLAAFETLPGGIEMAMSSGGMSGCIVQEEEGIDVIFDSDDPSEVRAALMLIVDAFEAGSGPAFKRDGPCWVYGNAGFAGSNEPLNLALCILAACEAMGVEG